MRTRIGLILLAACSLAACGDEPTPTEALGARPSGPATSTGTGCTGARGYGLAPVSSQKAWASVVGHVLPNQVQSAGYHFYTLTVTAKQAGYIQTAVAGGCVVTVDFETRGTTGGLGNGSAEYTGSADVQVGGSSAGGTGTESGSHPLAGCTYLVCTEDRDHSIALSGSVAAGSVITLTANATAFADAGGTDTSDQAHADWHPRYPRLLPIP
jgi:hypothetical protein